MPPEPLPFDRKDFFKERKPSSSDPAGVVPVRWRETPTTPSSHNNNHGSFSYRCGGAGGSSDFRRPFSGHRKQVGGGWHVTTLEPWQDKFCGNNNREINHINGAALASSSQKDRNGGNFRETTASPNDNSLPHSDFVNSWDQLLPKDQHDKNNGGGVGTAGGQRLDNENSMGSSIDWKPLKWIRSGSLTSRGSGFNHSSSSKSIGVDSVDIKIDAQPGNATPIQSPSEDAGPCLTPRTPADDVSSRKKPRLGWGEGLAKYEKKKVAPDDIVDKEAGTRNGMVDGVSSLEPLLPSPSSQLDKSPSLTGCSECASPATPYSFACSSSPGIEEKASVKAAEVDNDICNPSPPSCHHTEGSTFNLENLELTEAVNMTSLLNELLQSDEASAQASGFVRSTAMDKLQVWKANISRTLEITESEIDSLENELKSLVSDVGGSSFPAAFCSLPATESKNNKTEKKSGAFSFKVVSSGDMSIEKDGSVEEHTGIEDLDRESPGTATSKFVEPFTSRDNLTPSERVSSCILDIRSENTEAKCSQDDVSNSSLTTVPVGGDVHCKKEVKLHELISASNKADAHEASGDLTKLLPTSQWCTDIPTATNDSLIKERFATRKRFLKFKERVITLKFRTFQYLWKEDLRLLSVRKIGTKSQKKFELSSRIGFTDYQKHRSSIRSRFSSPAGNLSLVPTTEIIEYANKLLSDSQIKIYRNTVKMPSLILNKSERETSRFISDNGLVEDPCKVENERTLVNHWTSQEKEVFLENFSLFGKDFRKIASFLDHKTVADCVEFYYKNHKSERFQKTKKHPEFAKQGKSCTTNTYLVTSGKRWSREANAASLDILGAASAMAANVEGGKESQRKYTPKFYIGTSRDHKRVNGGVIDKSNSLALFCNERETAAADVLAGICGSISSEALSSCVTSLVDSADVYHQDRMCHKLGGYSSRHLSAPVASQNDFDEETCSDESCVMEMNPSDWTDEEKSSFMQAVRLYGKDFSMISRCMRTRSRDQCKLFYGKARKCLGLDAIHVEDKAGLNEGGDQDHDHDDTCMVDSGSVISCDKSSSEIKMEVEDLHSSDSKQELPKSDQIVVNECSEPEFEAKYRPEVEVNTVTKDLNSSGSHDPRDSCLDLSIDTVNNLELNPVEKPCDNGFLASSLLNRDPIVSSHKKTLSQDDISSRLSFRKSCSQRSSSTDGYHLHLPKHSLMDCVESSQVLKGYPVTVATNTSLGYKETQKSENLLPEHCLPRDCSLLQTCTSLSQEQRQGDVKLFGQILTKRPQESGGKSFDPKFDDRKLASLDVDQSKKNVTLRSHGYWDGNRIRMGVPSMPDSARLLAKYPAAFSKTSAFLKFDQNHQMHSPSLKMVSGFPSCSNNGGANGSQECVEPFRVDKLLLPTRKVNVVGGISDPVAAIRMHYANSELYKKGGIGGEGWRSNGSDIENR